VCSWVIIRHLPGSTEENGENIWMGHVPAEIQTQYLLNTSEEQHRYSHILFWTVLNSVRT